MIQPHSLMQTPPDDAILWRFMDFTKYVSILDTSLLYFAQAATMEDNYEGVLPKANVEQIREIFSKLDIPDAQRSAGVAHQINFLTWARTTMYLSCWHMNRHESAAMWKLYLKSDEGIAIRTTFANLKEALADAKDTIQAAVVKYIDYTTESIQVQTTFDPVIYKRKSFEHEAEVRLLWWSLGNRHLTHDPIPQDQPFPIYDKPVRGIPISRADLLQEVYVSPTSPGWFRDLVEAVTRKYGVGCSVVKSNLYIDPVW